MCYNNSIILIIVIIVIMIILENHHYYNIKMINAYFYCILMFSFVNFEPTFHFVSKDICPEFVRHWWYFSQFCFCHGRTKIKNFINLKIITL